MKLVKITAIALSLAALNAQAAPAPKSVAVPFSNVTINAADHEGLVFNYALNTAPATKVVCKLSNSYKSWFEYSNQGVVNGSGVFGGYETVVFSMTDQSNKNNEDIAYYQADQSGEIKVFETDKAKTSDATASCYYEADNKK